MKNTFSVNSTASCIEIYQRVNETGLNMPGAPRESKVAQQILRIRRKGLSAREIEVFLLLEKGLSNKEIAHRLGTSVNTVRAQIRNIYQKLKVSGRIEAINAVRKQTGDLKQASGSD